jgi:hypothetical protein
LLNTRPDFGRDRRGGAQAPDSDESKLAVAFSRPAPDHLQKKLCKQPNGSALTSRAHADIGFDSKAGLIPPDWYFSTKPRSAPTWFA